MTYEVTYICDERIPYVQVTVNALSEESAVEIANNMMRPFWGEEQNIVTVVLKDKLNTPL
jgi:capsular polysaccharide biosynthesis protein